jgi:hypothetical protein
MQTASHASSKPIPCLFSSIPKKRKPSKKPYLFPVDLSTRKTVRTIMLDAAGLPVGAKIDMSTGEITPHTYHDYHPPMRKAKPNPLAQDLEPFWMSMPAGSRRVVTKPRANPSRKLIVNKCKMYLEYVVANDGSDAMCIGLPLNNVIAEQLPALMNIIDSVNLLDMGGNTRGLSRTALASMLLSLDNITAYGVRDFMNCSVRHSERVAGCLRIIVGAFVRMTEQSYPQADS